MASHDSRNKLAMASSSGKRRRRSETSDKSGSGRNAAAAAPVRNAVQRKGDGSGARAPTRLRGAARLGAT